MAIDTTTTNSAFYATYGLEARQAAEKAEDAAKSNEMGKDEFMKLMITQMNNQDPLEPQGNAEYMAQLAQLSMVEGIQSLNTVTEGFITSLQSSQALQASALVGRKIQVQSDIGNLVEGGTLAGSIFVPSAAQNMDMMIVDNAGQVIKTMDTGEYRNDSGYFSEGQIDFEWDGTMDNGEMAQAGLYQVVSSAEIEGQAYALTAYTNANVNSVTIANGGEVWLNLAGKGSVALSEVNEFF
ncbi:flagellar hook assembly protein FlgD [Oceanospirillum maris]|jgi:flagellar basal-body rod modification protein FlgD|uniref:flagellar hook assembly protein FlgD n=1 Tax=Oceanospirillum maris TaxID=64977 RepID=UPI000428F45E|nr:flagellar hook assembly protein FlgD [Oceanospirillum maris]